MAKQKKGGLGRGLNSLLGGDDNVSSTAAVSQKPQPENVRVTPPNIGDGHRPIPNAPQVQRAIQENKEEKKEDNLEEKAEEKKAIQPEKTLYTNKEDNITIKSVVERKVDRSQIAIKGSLSNSQADASKDSEDKQYDEIPIELIKPNPSQPRSYFNKDELEELAESIKKNGLLQPILVRKAGDEYEIVAGERRWQACKLLGMKTVPARIKEVTDEDTIVLALVENIQRTDLNPIEEAYGYKLMMERGKMTQSQVAQAVSKGRSTIANALRLLELPEEAQQLLFEEQITAGHARAILSVPTKEGKEKLTEKLVKENLSVRETEAIARLMSHKKEEKQSDRPTLPKSYKTVARSLRDALKTDVRVKTVKGKNKIIASE